MGVDEHSRIGIAPWAAGVHHGNAREAHNVSMQTVYLDKEPARAEVDGWSGPALLEFGTPWCGWCRGAQPKIAQALAAHPAVRHVKVEDGSGRPLGRSYGVKLWPTLVFLRDGQEVARLVRPGEAREISDALALVDSP
jgi:thioredoxin 1